MRFNNYFLKTGKCYLYTPVWICTGLLGALVLAQTRVLSYLVIYLLAGLFGISFACAARYWEGHRPRPVPRAAMFCACMVMVGAAIGGACGYRMLQEQRTVLPIGVPLVVFGTVEQDTVLRGDYARNAIRIEQISVDAVTRYSASGRVTCGSSESEAYRQGDRVTAHIVITQRTEPGAQDSGAAVRQLCNASSIAMQSGEGEAGVDIKRALRSVRRAAQNGLDSYFTRYPPPSARLLRALILGKRDQLHPQISEFFRGAGSTHVLALSGMHLAIMLGLGYLLFLRIFGKKTTLVLLIAGVLVYLFVVGRKPSLERAGIMFIIWSVMVLLNRKSPSVNILALSFVIFVMLVPSVVNDLSFQLSYAALSGMILFSPVIQYRLQHWVPRPLAAPLAASLSAQLFALPLVGSAFGVIYPIGVFASLILAPLVTLFIWVHVLALPALLLPVPLVHSAADALSAGLYRILVTVAAAFAKFPPISL